MVSSITPKIYSVSEFVYYMRDVLKSQVGNVVIQGEIEEIKSPRDLVYIKIKDEKSRLLCFILKKNIKTKIEVGTEIKILGYPQLFVGSGGFYLQILAIELVGEGALQKAYDALKKKLDKEGLFAEEYKQPLPQFPEKNRNYHLRNSRCIC